MSTLLLELYGEEIPAKMQENALGNLSNKIVLHFEKYFEKNIHIDNWVTPRRLGFHFDNIIFNTNDSNAKEIKGPRIDAPEIVINGFLGKYKSQKEKLIVKNGYYYLNLEQASKNPRDLIKEIIEIELLNFVWPKSMKWGSNKNISWIRPLKSLLCLWNGEVLPIEFGHLTASDITYGHRVHSSGEIKVNNFEDYQTKLKDAYVILNSNDRKDIILKDIKKITAKLNLTLYKDEELLNEIVGLVEYPKVYLGDISPEFMALPQEVLIITLKHHQKYLMLQNNESNIAPYFIIISNIDAIDGGQEIINGNSKVLKARLSDAKFFVDNDKSQTLISRLEKLKTLTFHKDIGSVYEKKESVKRIIEKISSFLSLDASRISLACDLAKADLTTSMVKEFPELQGIIGYYYALNDNIDEEIAIAIKDQYKPRGPSDTLPTNIIGKVLALSDKLDTLNHMFAINIKPTGSKDPYALRRAAIGIIRIILSENILHKLFLTSLISEDVKNFILERAKYMLDSNLINSNNFELLKKII